MLLQRWLVLGIAPLVVWGCVGSQVSADQQDRNSVSGDVVSGDSVSASPTDESSITQSSDALEAQSSASAELATVVKSGRFEAGEHPTSGIVQLVQENGNFILELDESFQTSSSGPDLVVILHRSNDVLGGTVPPAYPIEEEDYVILAPLQEFSGSQRYTIPADINVEDYQSAAIWCRRFNATFGAAVLQ